MDRYDKNVNTNTINKYKTDRIRAKGEGGRPLGWYVFNRENHNGVTKVGEKLWKSLYKERREVWSRRGNLIEVQTTIIMEGTSRGKTRITVGDL